MHFLSVSMKYFQHTRQSLQLRLDLDQMENMVNQIVHEAHSVASTCTPGQSKQEIWRLLEFHVVRDPEQEK